MQVIWSRATQQLSSACRCSSCLSATTAASRRTTTATARRRLRFGDVFTVFYSSVLATAAVADAQWKDVKRQDLDASIARAINELKVTEAEQERRLQALKRVRDDRNDVIQDNQQSKHWSHGSPRMLSSDTSKTNLHAIADHFNHWTYDNRVQDRCPDKALKGGHASGIYSHSKTAQRTGKDTQSQAWTTQISGANDRQLGDRDGKLLPKFIPKEARIRCHDDLSIPSVAEHSITPGNPKKGRFGSFNGKGGNPPADVLASNRDTEEEKKHTQDLDESEGPLGWVVAQKYQEVHRSRAEVAKMKFRTALKTPKKKIGIRLNLELQNTTDRCTPRAISIRKKEIQISLPSTGFNEDASQSPLSRRVGQEHWSEVTAKGIKKASKMVSTWLKQPKSREFFVSDYPVESTRGRASGSVWKTSVSMEESNQHQNSILSASITKLICRLLLITLDGSKHDSTGYTLPGQTEWRLNKAHRLELDDRAAKMEKLLSELKSGDNVSGTTNIEVHRYAQSQESLLNNDHLNEELSRALTGDGDIGDHVPRVCCHLAASSTPPSVHTYNILIIQLCHLQYYNAASVVIDSMTECDIQPNEVTRLAILRFYTCTRDFHGFNNYVADMNRDRLYYHVRLPILRSKIRTGQSVLQTRASPNCHVSPCNRDTYAALICGWLAFHKPDHALMEYITMLRSGWRNVQGILLAFLKYSVEVRNWNLGVAAWEDMKDSKNRPALKEYHWMLQLCVICNKPTDFDSVLREGILRRGVPSTVQMSDFASSDAELRKLMRDSRVWDRLKQPIFLSGPMIQVGCHSDQPLLSVWNLRNWIAQSLSMVYPARRVLAEEAKSILTQRSQHVAVTKGRSKTWLKRIRNENASEMNKHASRTQKIEAEYGTHARTMAAFTTGPSNEGRNITETHAIQRSPKDCQQSLSQSKRTGFLEYPKYEHSELPDDLLRALSGKDTFWASRTRPEPQREI